MRNLVWEQFVRDSLAASLASVATWGGSPVSAQQRELADDQQRLSVEARDRFVVQAEAGEIALNEEGRQ